jgi:ATP-dependent protease ClpP protease subunit
MQRDQVFAMALNHRPFKELITERLRAQANPQGLVIKNAAGPKAVIRIYDEIGFFGVSAEDVAAALEDITADEIEVQINSMGGDAFDGVAIYNALRSHPAQITTRVDSLAASAASIIAQAGDKRIMLTGSQMMIHDAWGLAIGNAEVMRSTAGVLDKLSNTLADIYEERSGRAGMRDEMLAESWYTHDEAVEAGLADEAVKPSKKARVDPPNRFTDQLAEAVASLEQVTAEAENVMTFRSEQGKTPLSDEAVALVDKAVAALTGLTAEPEPKVNIADLQLPDNNYLKELTEYGYSEAAS